jgi:signal transduction histidine kinase
MPDSHSGTLSILAPAVLRRLLAIFLPAPVLLGAVVLVLYFQDLSNEKALYEQAGSHLVDLHEDIITRELLSVESDLLYLANQAVLRDFLSGRATTRKELQDEYVLFSRQKGLYDQIRFLDTGGKEIIRVNYNGGAPAAVAENELQPKASRYYFAQAQLLDRSEVFISPFDLNVEHDEVEVPRKPVIRFATPVFDASGAKRGVLVLNYLGAVLIGKLIAVSVNSPGSAVLLNRAGYYLHGPNPEEEWGFMFDQAPAFPARYPDEWEGIVRLGRGHLHTRRGLFSFRTLAPPVDKASEGGPPRLPAPAGQRGATYAGLVVVSVVRPAIVGAKAGDHLRRILLVYGMALALVFVLACYLAKAGALRRDQERQIAQSEARLRKLSAQLLTAQEDERRSLSRDLHDELGQVVTAVLLDLQRAAPPDADGKTRELIARAQRGAECLLERLHEFAARIRPPLLDDLGLKDAVQNFLGEYERSTGIVPRADLHFANGEIPAAVSENVYRILQEALANVARHAGVQEVRVELHAEPKRVSLVVRDDGAGFAPERLDTKGLGILGMRERAELLDGTFQVRSEPGKGTEVRVNLPLGRAHALPQRE